VTAAVLTDMVRGTQFSNNSGNMTHSFFLYNRISDFSISVNRLHHACDTDCVTKASAFEIT
jgi:hypothetical protein